MFLKNLKQETEDEKEERNKQTPNVLHNKISCWKYEGV